MRTSILIVVYAALLGTFLAFAGIGMAGGGHGSSLPLLVYFGLFTLLLVGEQIWIGGALYAAYAVIFWKLRQKSGYAGALLVAFHYCSVGAMIFLWRGQMFERISEDFSSVWRYMPGWLIASMLAFAATNTALLLSTFRATRPESDPAA